MHLQRKFGRSIKSFPAKQVVPLNRGVLISIIGAICELGVIDLTLRKPMPVAKKSSEDRKKRKRNGDSAEETVEDVNGRVGTRAMHFLEFLNGMITCLDQNGMMTCLDQNDMSGRYIVVDNATIYKTDEVQVIFKSESIKLHNCLHILLF